MQELRFHHVSIICKDYEASLHFYCDLLGLTNFREGWSANKNAKKIELHDANGYVIELFAKEDAPANAPVALAPGFDHLAFSVKDPAALIERLAAEGVPVEAPRLDKVTGKHYAFAYSPDGLKIEFYEE